MNSLPFSFLFLFLNCAGFSHPPRDHIQCGYRGTFCTPGECPYGNSHLGSCGSGYSCCRW
uniref:Beta-defensin-like domain-containing protein n=1 Tax=Pavo cristatus TaxID=9049 RepID=A0A8C9FWD1_PAVCR